MALESRPTRQSGFPENETDLFSKRKQISIFLKILIFVPQSEVKPLCKLISVEGLLKPYCLVKEEKKASTVLLFSSHCFSLVPACVSHNGIDCHNTKSVCRMNVSNDNIGKYIQGHTLPAAAMSLSSHSHVEDVEL